MRTVGLITEEPKSVDNVIHLRFMVPLCELVREKGKQKSGPRTAKSTPGWNLKNVIATQTCYYGVK